MNTTTEEKTGKFLLIAHGTTDDATLAKEILHRSGLESIEIHRMQFELPVFFHGAAS